VRTVKAQRVRAVRAKRVRTVSKTVEPVTVTTARTTTNSFRELSVLSSSVIN
jgi:hypothetical protein